MQPISDRLKNEYSELLKELNVSTVRLCNDAEAEECARTGQLPAGAFWQEGKLYRDRPLDEMDRFLWLQHYRNIRTIKRSVVFFVVLVAIPIVIGLLAVLTGSSILGALLF